MDSMSKSGKASSKAIVAAARKLFLKHGYDGVNLDAVAKKAGVARQTLYNNFGGKEAIFRAVLNDHWQRIRANGFSDSSPAHADTIEPMLREFAQRTMTFIENADQVDFTRLVIAETRRTPWIGHEFYEVGKGPLVRDFANRLEHYARAGSLSCENTLLAAHQFFGLILECAFWPYVMAIGPATSELPSVDVSIEEAMKMFLARYAC